jgi:hypothetical protein
VVPGRGRMPRRSPVLEHAEAFVGTRLSIIKDPKAAASDRLRAMEQLESRALGKPKEKVAHEAEEPEVLQELREMTPEQRRLLLRQWNEGDVEEAAEH